VDGRAPQRMDGPFGTLEKFRHPGLQTDAEERMTVKMKTAIAGALALGVVAAAGGAQAGGLDCCRRPAEKAAACCPAGPSDSKICLDLQDLSAAEAAKRLSQAIGAEVRVQGAAPNVSLKLCAPNREAALKQVAKALNARLRTAFIFGARPVAGERIAVDRKLSLTFRGAPTSSAAFVTAAQAGGILIADKPLKGRVSFHGQNVPAKKVLDAIAVASGVTWKPAYVLQIGPQTLVRRVWDPNHGPKSMLKLRPDSPARHIHRGHNGGQDLAPAPGMIVKDPEAETARLEAESLRRAKLGEWAGVFTQETPKEIRRAVRDLRIRVETAIQKLESYPPQNRHLGAGLWRARYERMLEDYKSLTPEQQKQVQPVLDAMKYFADPTSTQN
jgi:hypothetical protein